MWAGYLSQSCWCLSSNKTRSRWNGNREKVTVVWLKSDADWKTHTCTLCIISVQKSKMEKEFPPLTTSVVWHLPVCPKRVIPTSPAPCSDKLLAKRYMLMSCKCHRANLEVMHFNERRSIPISRGGALTLTSVFKCYWRAVDQHHRRGFRQHLL